MSLRLRQAGLDIGIASVSEAFVAEFHQMHTDSLLRFQILNAYSFGLSGIHLVFTSISGVSLLISSLMKHFDMLLPMRKTLKQLATNIGDGLRRQVSLYGSLGIEGLTGQNLSRFRNTYRSEMMTLYNFGPF
jgi:hypothetical protein